MEGIRQLIVVAENIEQYCKLAGLSEVFYKFEDGTELVLSPNDPDKCWRWAQGMREMFGIKD